LKRYRPDPGEPHAAEGAWLIVAGLMVVSAALALLLIVQWAD
jgi:hypothetical protein